MTEACRFVLLGTGGNFTCHVLQALIRQGFLPHAYIQPGSDPQHGVPSLSMGGIKIDQPASPLKQLLNENCIALYYQSEQSLAALIEQLKTDYLLVACWPELLPKDVLRRVSIAALNLHPSLLPAFRGANPITDQRCTDDANFGITLHLLNENFDEGDIVLQKPLDAGKITDTGAIERLAAESGAELFIQALKTRLTPGWNLVRQKPL